MKLKKVLKERVLEIVFLVYDFKKQEVLKQEINSPKRNLRLKKQTIKWQSKVH